MTTDHVNAFVPDADVRIEGRAGGPLAGLTFAEQDFVGVQRAPFGIGGEQLERRVVEITKQCDATQERDGIHATNTRRPILECVAHRGRI